MRAFSQKLSSSLKYAIGRSNLIVQVQRLRRDLSMSVNIMRFKTLEAMSYSDSCETLYRLQDMFLRDINNYGLFRGVFCPDSFVVIVFLNTTSFRRELNYREELLNPELTKLTGLRSPSFFSFSASCILQYKKSSDVESRTQKERIIRYLL